MVPKVVVVWRVVNEYFISLRFGTRDSKQPTLLFLKVELFKFPILQCRLTDDWQWNMVLPGRSDKMISLGPMGCFKTSYSTESGR